MRWRGDDAADEALLLDLLNTTPVVDGEPTDALAQWPSARTWMRQRSLGDDAAQWRALLEARALLQAVVRGDRPAAALSPILDGVRGVPELVDGRIGWALETAGGHDAAARCVLAWDRLQGNGTPRLRPCANTECRLFLVDRSKPNTARWCSMAVCGNRMKARRHHQRRRDG